jgi:MYXO-CTERM domain-containing protein
MTNHNVPRAFGRTAAVAALLLAAAPAHAEVTTVAELVAAVSNGQPGDTVVVAAGTFALTESLRPKAGMKIRGAGAGKTIITNAASWAPGNAGLELDEGAQIDGVDCSKYLINLQRDILDVMVSDLTLLGTAMPGGVCGIASHRLELARLEFKSFLWAGARIFIMEGGKIHNNSFFDAAGKRDVTTGPSGGSLFLTYFGGTDISGNRFARSPGNDGYGVKGREARNVRIHDNTIDVFFSIELPFESDHTVEIDHNYLGGAISMPKYAGGDVPTGGYTFHIHHNYFNTSYSFEYQRNAVEIDHNLFDFSPQDDGGNLIASFDAVPAALGGTKMHNNLIKNPGRGIYWNEGVYNGFAFYNNHVQGQTTVTPRTEGLFDFRPARNEATTNFSTIEIRDNIIELTGMPRPLMRNPESYAALISNNALTGLSDTASYGNPTADRPRGPLQPLCFRLGADREWTIDGWKIVRTPSPVPDGDCTVDVPGGGNGSDDPEPPPQAGGCGCSAPGTDGSGVVLLVGLTLLAARRRRR